MRLRFVPAGALVAAALAVAGCGGGSSSSDSSSTSAGSTPTTATFAGTDASFKSDLGPIFREMKGTAIATVGAIRQASGQGNAQLAATFSGLENRWGTALEQLNNLDPPADLEDEYAATTRPAASAETELHAVATAARTNDATAAREATVKLVKDLAAVKAAAQKLQAAAG